MARRPLVRGLFLRSALCDVAASSAGAAILPALAVLGTPVHAALWQAAWAAGIAMVAVAAASGLAVGRQLIPVGVAMTGAAAWLLAQSSYPVGAWLVAPMLGIGITLGSRPVVASRRSGALVRALIPAVVWVAVLVAVRILVSRDAVMAAGAAGVAVGALAGWFGTAAGTTSRRRTIFAAALAPLLAVTTIAYIGATTPSATWFGSLVHSGPRGSDQVALTFDDGPDPPYSMRIASILDSYGVKGTFFTVGKALEARPDVSKALLEDGQLLGNHSYNHDAFSWLAPGYPELRQTQESFKLNLGVCPAFYRPPHGSHTPFMAKVVEDQGMTMVTWDVSAADWATDDPGLVAKRVLDKVRPGSIILLHDGLDGNIGADRSVVVEALPIILDGLRNRGLKPVRLDELLGIAGYLPNC